jgi:hypothetical protein
MDSRNLICWSNSLLTTKVVLNPPHYLINMHMGHYGTNSKLAFLCHEDPNRGLKVSKWLKSGLKSFAPQEALN